MNAGKYKNSWQRLAHRLRLLKSYLRREPVCPGLPLSAIISSTSRCNLHCPMCPRAITEFSNRDIDFGLFCKIVDEGAPWFEFVIPQGGGEPLLNPRIFEMVRYSKAKGLRVGFSTNATLLRGETTDALIDSGLDYLIFAFDGATPEVYEQYRQGARFEDTRQKILNFLQRKKERHSGIVVTVQMVRLPGNAHQIETFKKLWRVEGVNDIRIKEDEIHVAGVSLPPTKPSKSSPNPCFYLWQGPIYISEDGDVFPCCHAWTAEPLGNVGKNPLREIWNNEKIQSMRRAHAKGDVSAFDECVNCYAARPKLPLIIGSFLVNSFQVRKFIPLAEKLSLHKRLPLFEDRQ